MFIKILTREQIIETLNTVKNGQIVRVTYQSEVPLTARFKSMGYEVIKFTETSVRTGVNYWNIEAVIKRKLEKAAEPVRKVTNNYKWLINNKVKYHEKTGKEYLVVAPLKKGDHTKTFYSICYDGSAVLMSEEEFKKAYEEMVIKSYWTPSKTGEDIKTISFENVISLANTGSRLNFDFFK